ncbi:MAG: DUF58 domain-containing protein [Thaumarchaeota archaeon]|nr:DUF58 domain-containing protein [Nitrososphaerota archaeon]
MLTRKSGLAVAFALWVFALGLLLTNAPLMLASVAVVIYFTLVRITEPGPHVDLSVERILDADSIYEGETATVTLRVRNNGAPITTLEVSDALPHGLRLSRGSNLALTSLRRGETKTIDYSVEPVVFGSYEIGPVKIRTTDLGRNRTEERTVESLAPLLVYPEIRYVNRMTIRPVRTKNWPGETVARRTGPGIDYYGVREYASGDSLRRVNWKATSRSEDILINKFLHEAGGDILVVLDSRPVSEVGSPPNSLLTRSTRAAAAITYRLLRDRNRVGFLGIGDTLASISPGFGKRQFEKILVSLVSLGSGEDWDIENLPRLLSIRFSRQTRVIFISPLMDESSAEAVIRTSTSGYSVIVVSPSPLDIEGSVGVAGDERRVAEKLLDLRRRVLLSSLGRYATVVDWDTTEPLGDAVNRVAEQRAA